MAASTTATAAAVPSALQVLLERGYTHKRALDLASMAEACGRYADMSAVAGELVRQRTAENALLTPLECNLVSVSFKNCLSSFRTTLKMLGLVAAHETVALHLDAVQSYARDIERHVLEVAQQVLDLAALQLPLCEAALTEPDPVTPPAAAAAPASSGASAGATGGSATSSSTAPAAPPSRGSSSGGGSGLRAGVDAICFWHKLSGDYCRYVAECHTDADTVTRFSDLALSYYAKARSYASAHFHPAHPVPLGVGLNMSVYLFEIRRCEAEAYEIATGVLAEAKAAVEEDEKAAGSSGDAASPAAAAAGGAATGGAAAVDTTAAAAAAAAVAKRLFPPLTAQERREGDAVAALIRENIRVWSQVLKVSELVL